MQVLNIGNVKGKNGNVGHQLTPRPRPDITTGVTEKVPIGCGNLYITVNYDDKGICEVFTNTGKAGGCPSQSEATSRLVSIALRAGVDPKVIIEQLQGIRCPSTMRQGDIEALSCPDAIARVMEKVMALQYGQITVDQGPRANKEHCPECGKEVQFQGGCMICQHCGYSKCS